MQLVYGGDGTPPTQAESRRRRPESPWHLLPGDLDEVTENGRTGIVVRSGHTAEWVVHEGLSEYSGKTSYTRRHTTTLASVFGIIEIDTSGLKRIA